MPVIGKGDIVLTGKDKNLTKDLVRELNIHIGSTSSEKAGLKANIPVSDLVEFIQTRLMGVAEGVAAGDDPKQKDGIDKEDDVKYELPIEILDINPDIKTSEAKYCLVVIVDNSIEEVNKELKIKDINVGHAYIALGEITEFGDVKILPDQLHGMNPKKEGVPIGDGKITKEADRFAKVKKYRDKKQTSVSVKKAIAITEAGYKDLRKFIDQRKSNPGEYFAHFHDCIEFTDQAIKASGLKELKLTDIIKPSDISGFPFIKPSIWLRSNDYQGVEGFSREQIASDYDVSIERVVENHNIYDNSGVQIAPRFRILPHPLNK